jgi:hypothetical protein
MLPIDKIRPNLSHRALTGFNTILKGWVKKSNGFVCSAGRKCSKRQSKPSSARISPQTQSDGRALIIKPGRIFSKRIICPAETQGSLASISDCVAARHIFLPQVSFLESVSWVAETLSVAPLLVPQGNDRGVKRSR